MNTKTSNDVKPIWIEIAQFSDSGERLAIERVQKIVKTEDEWRKQLGPEAYEVTRQSGTERACTGQYWDLHDKGLYRCICCDTALFIADSKFESGTGWPSFTAPVAAENVATEEDRSYGMRRVSVSCKRCDAHLGHVFDDGPRPTGQRFCMNSAAMRFVKFV